MKWAGLTKKLQPLPLGAALGTLAVSSYLTATGFARLNEPVSPALQGSDKPSTQAQVAPGRPTTLEISQAVLSRNIFDSTVGPMPWQERPPEPEKPAATDTSAAEPQAPASEKPITDCPSDIRLSAVFMADDSSRSFAVLQRGATPAQQVRLGATLDNFTLLTIAPTLVFLRQADGSICRTLLYRTSAPPVAAAAPAPTPAKPATAAKASTSKQIFSDAELEAGITALGGDRYRVSRSLLTAAMANATALTQGVRFVPQTGEQRNAGVKVQRLTDKAVLYKLGVRNNDVLRTINGIDLSSTEGMLSAYTLLRESNTISLAITRSGSAKTLTYEVE